MLLRVWAAALALLVLSSSGASLCAIAAIAGGPARSRMHASAPDAASARDEAASISARCPCRCTGDVPHVVASSPGGWVALAAPVPPLRAETTFARGEHRPRMESLSRAPLDHVPIAS